MPIHDWTRVEPGDFHDFHVGWVTALRSALNNGVLPPGYYAKAEQLTRGIGPDVLTPRSPGDEAKPDRSETEGGLAVVDAPPRVSQIQTSAGDFYIRRRRSVVVRAESDRASSQSLRSFRQGTKIHPSELPSS